MLGALPLKDAFKVCWADAIESLRGIRGHKILAGTIQIAPHSHNTYVELSLTKISHRRLYNHDTLNPTSLAEH